MNTCPCGRPVSAGRTAGAAGNTQCLICQTDELMRTLPKPKKAPVKKKKQKVTQ